MPFDSIPPEIAEAMLADPKLQELPAGLFKTWFNIHLIAVSYGGALPSLQETAFHLRMGKKSAERQIEELKAAGLIDEVDGALVPMCRERRRSTVERVEQIVVTMPVKDRTAAARARRYRERQRMAAGGVTETVTEGVTRHGREREIEYIKSKISLSAARDVTRDGGDSFRRFWAAFPDRGDGDNPQTPAIVAWRKAISAGADPEQIIMAAAAYAAAVTGREKRFICSAARWLAESRWRNAGALSAPPAASSPAPGVWLAAGSPGWKAWAIWWAENKGGTPPRDSKDGWRFPAPMPPAREVAA